MGWNPAQALRLFICYKSFVKYISMKTPKFIPYILESASSLIPTKLMLQKKFCDVPSQLHKHHILSATALNVERWVLKLNNSRTALGIETGTSCMVVGKATYCLAGAPFILLISRNMIAYIYTFLFCVLAFPIKL